MKPSDRLLIRLVQMGLPVPEGARVVRTYAGRHQRAAGAWSWCLDKCGPDGWTIGSQHPVTELLRGRMVASQGWRSEDWHIDPEVWGTCAGAPPGGGPFVGRGGARLIAEPIRFRRSSGS